MFWKKVVRQLNVYVTHSDVHNKKSCNVIHYSFFQGLKTMTVEYIFNHALPITNRLKSVDKIEFSPATLQKYIKLRKPVIFTNMIEKWPAYQNWNINYLMGHCNSTNIYIKKIKENKKEVMRFSDALKIILAQHENKIKNGIVIQMCQIITGNWFSRGQPILATLKNDIIIPDIITPKKIVEVNFWAGSGNTITELHYDPTENLLSMITGRKNIVIFPPNQTKLLYNISPKISKKSITHSVVDIQSLDLKKYPNLAHAKYYECGIKKGETLYLPNGFWHVVESLDLNMAVNIWWLPKFNDFLKLPVRRFWKAEVYSRIKGKGSCVPHTHPT